MEIADIFTNFGNESDPFETSARFKQRYRHASSKMQEIFDVEVDREFEVEVFESSCCP